MMNCKHICKVSVFLLFFTLFTVVFSPISFAQPTLSQLNTSLRSVELRGKELENSLRIYEQKITSLKNNIVSLQNQLEIIDLEYTYTKTSIEEVQNKISFVENEMKLIEKNIEQLNKKISSQERLLVQIVQLLYEEDTKKLQSLIDILLSSENFSDVLNGVEYLSLVEKEASTIYISLQSNKIILDEQRDILRYEKLKKEALLAKLVTQKRSLISQNNAKISLIAASEGQEENFQKLHISALEQRKQVIEEINSIINDITAESSRLETLRELTSTQGFKWPIPVNTITAGFQSSSYKKRFGWAHTGIDVRAAAGTTIISPKDAVVAKVIPPTSKNLSYIILDHGGEQTVYLHLSKVFVEAEDQIKQGQVFAETGGVPGANGTGIGLSTGPHLHFEIREDGVPVDPTKYLP